MLLSTQLPHLLPDNKYPLNTNCRHTQRTRVNGNHLLVSMMLKSCNDSATEIA